MVIYRQFDVVVVPFPFTDRTVAKKRPALVLSSDPFNSGICHSVLVMITTASHSPWPLDVALANLKNAGLKKPSIVRMKLFMIDNQLILKHVGCLDTLDRISVKSALQNLLS